MNAKESAHYLAENYGWHVFPAKADKTPACMWKDKATNNHDEIDALPWENAAFAAVYCGKSGISVLDIDTIEGRKQLQQDLGSLPSTMQQQTPRGGTHLIFDAPPFPQSIGAGIPCEGVDIRSGDGYICWYGKGDGLEWDRLPWPYKAPLTGRKGPALALVGATPDFAVKEGGRNHDLARELGSILREKPGIHINELARVAREYSHNHHSPPLEDAEIVKTIKSIYTKAAAAKPEQVFKPRAGTDLGALMAMHMEPTRYVCAPFVAEGYTLYVGKPKIGKTTLMRQLVAAAHMGTEFLGYPCEKTGVMFLSLEESPKVFRKKMLGMGYKPSDMDGLDIHFEWPSGEAGLHALSEYLKEHQSVKLIVIDGMARIKGHIHERSASVFDVDYKEGQMIQEFCKARPGLAIVVLHHTRKAEALDPMDLVSGSHGVTAAADMVCVLHMTPLGGYVMHWEGRDWMEDISDYEIRREGGRWAMVGEAMKGVAQLRSNATTQQSILLYLRDEGESTGKTIAEHLGIDASTVSKACSKMASSGSIRKGSFGWLLV